MLIVCAVLFAWTAMGRTQSPPSQPPPTSKAPQGDSSAYISPGPVKSVEVGDFYLKRKKYQAAISRFEEAAQTDPEYPAAYLGLGKAYEKLGLRQKSLDSYQKYLDLLPSDKDAEGAKDVQRAMERLRQGRSR